MVPQSQKTELDVLDALIRSWPGVGRVISGRGWDADGHPDHYFVAMEHDPPPALAMAIRRAAPGWHTITVTNLADPAPATPLNPETCASSRSGDTSP